MEREIGRSLRILEILRPQLTALTRTLNPIDIGTFGITTSLFQSQQAELAQLFSAAVVSARQTDLIRAALSLDQLSVLPPFGLNALDGVHASWLSALKEVSAPSIQLADLAKLTLSQTSFQLMTLEPLIDVIDFRFLSERFKIQDSVVAGLRRSFANLTDTFRSLAGSFQTVPAVIQLPMFVLPGATRGLSVSGYAVEALRPWEASEYGGVSPEISTIEEADVEVSGLPSLLEMIAPGLVHLYTGACNALNGNNPERQRHVLTSLRTLWDELFRVIAPDADVVGWIDSQGFSNEEYMHEGRPTRRTRLKYVLRNVDDGPLTDFVDAYIRMALQLHSVYNRVHITEPGLSDQQLRATVLNSDASLEYFISVYKQWG